MKRRQFIKSFILFSSVLFVNPIRLFASINSVSLGKKVTNFLFKGFKNNNMNQSKFFIDIFS